MTRILINTLSATRYKVIRQLSVGLFLWGTFMSLATAGLVVYEDVTPNSAWPDTPLASSATDPQVSSSGIGADDNALAQTFVASSNFTLQAVAFSYWTTADNTGKTITLSIFEVADAQGLTIPTSGSPDLLGGGSGLAFTTSIITGGSGSDEDLLILELTGADQISLTSGTHYALQIAGETGVSFAWGREGSGGSLGGEGYTNGTPITGCNFVW
jgi:hypothetical protein